MQFLLELSRREPEPATCNSSRQGSCSSDVSGRLQPSNSASSCPSSCRDALAVDEVLKYAFQRRRPFEANRTGRFFQGASHGSFPSAHATLSFAFTSVLAHEYPGWLTKVLAYGGASAISAARVTGKQTLSLRCLRWYHA
jgi:hypothetical protein